MSARRRPTFSRSLGRDGSVVPTPSRRTLIVAATMAAATLTASPAETGPEPAPSAPEGRAPRSPEQARRELVPPGEHVRDRPAGAVLRTPAPAAPHLWTAPDAIRWCESRDNYQAENPVSSASGAWQFIDGTWEAVTGLKPPASTYSREVQDAAFYMLWNQGKGASHWRASAACWEPLVGTVRR